MQPKKPKAHTEKYIWFDYEAEKDTGIHKPNLTVAHYFEGTKFSFKTNDELQIIQPLCTISNVMTRSSS